jgi:FtsZ-binding cell division protein ZapB
VDQLSTTLGATSTNIDRMVSWFAHLLFFGVYFQSICCFVLFFFFFVQGDRVLQAEDTLRLVRVEFADVKRDADASQTSMSEAADKMHTRVNSIEEDVHSWDKSVDSMRADVDRLESAFKRVQFELLNSESRGIGSPFAGLGAGGGGGNAVAAPDADDDFRPRPFSRSQPQIRSADADAALSARRHQLPGQSSQTAQDDPDAAAKRAALAAHGLKVIQEERDRREREEKQKAQGNGPRPIGDIHLEPQRDDRSLAQKYI